MWLGSVVVRALDLQSTGCGFDSRPPHCRVASASNEFLIILTPTDLVILRPGWGSSLDHLAELGEEGRGGGRKEGREPGKGEKEGRGERELY